VQEEEVIVRKLLEKNYCKVLGKIMHYIDVTPKVSGLLYLDFFHCPHHIYHRVRTIGSGVLVEIFRILAQISQFVYFLVKYGSTGEIMHEIDVTPKVSGTFDSDLFHTPKHT